MQGTQTGKHKQENANRKTQRGKPQTQGKTKSEKIKAEETNQM